MLPTYAVFVCFLRQGVALLPKLEGSEAITAHCSFQKIISIYED